jgi:hypothetical protein
VGIDRSLALNWSNQGIHSPKSLKIQVLFLGLMTYIIPLCFILYVIFSQNWLLFLFLPVLVIGFFIFHPSQAMILGPIRGGLILLTFILLVYSFASNNGPLMAVTLSLVFLWYSQKKVYEKAIRGATNEVLKNEDFLCRLWEMTMLNIQFYDGKVYWANRTK